MTLQQGTFGSISDFQIYRDTKASLNLGQSTKSSPRFPFLRDFTHIILISVICLTIPVVHKQWRLLALSVPALVDSGALKPKSIPIYSRLHKMLLIERCVNSRPTAATRLHALIESANAGMTRAGHWGLWLITVGSFFVAVFLVVGANQNGIFKAYSGDVPAAELSTWVERSYESWWASIDHPGGMLIYLALMGIGMFLVLVQNLVGLVAVWTFYGFTAVADLDIDWIDRDGAYGWRGVTDVYRTIFMSLSMHGIAMSITLLAFGIENVPWVITVLVIWSIMLPTVTLGPMYALRGMSDAAQERRISELLAAATTTGPLTAIQGEELRKIIQEVRTVEVRPLRVINRIELPAFFVAVILPVILTGLQIYFSLAGTK
ncbi:hypothetical protein ACFWPK_28500 [Nocardia sp. NPDC058519]|uniref:hypothetical protein n=1 Tax=Nocardia sp. NPDC058519 TaxID=3346535 RepID=UPI003650C4EC